MLPILLTLNAGVFTVTEKALRDLLPTPAPLPSYRSFFPYITGFHDVPRTCQAHPFLGPLPLLLPLPGVFL